MEEKFLEFVADVLDTDPAEISLQTKYKEYGKWDSLAMMNLVMELEEEYDVSIPIEKLSSVKTLEDMLKLVQEGD